MRISMMIALVATAAAAMISAPCGAETWEEYIELRKQAETPKVINKAIAGPRVISKDIVIAKLKKGEPIEFTSESILFEYGLAQVRQDSLPQLHIIAESLKDPQVKGVPKFVIAGHTCDIGSEANNCRLSWERANAVVDYLVSVGVPEDRLAPMGFGETEPMYSNTSEENRKKNRRVVLIGKEEVADPASLALGTACDPDAAPARTATDTSLGPSSSDSGARETTGASEIDRLKDKAENGDTSAMCRLGDMYYYGNGVEQDYGEAAYWYGSALDDEHTCSPSKGFLEAKDAYLKKAKDLPGFKKTKAREQTTAEQAQGRSEIVNEKPQTEAAAAERSAPAVLPGFKTKTIDKTPQPGAEKDGLPGFRTK